MSEQTASQLQECVQRIDEIRRQFTTDVAELRTQSLTPRSVEDVKVKFLGRKGLLTALMETLKGLSKDDKPAAGKIINVLRQELETQLEGLRHEAEEQALDLSLAAN
ncbi:MAG: hypothetical protein ACOVS5_10595, partial [Oligoflexus sp.]